MGLVDNISLKLIFSDNTEFDINASNYLMGLNFLFEVDDSLESLTGNVSSNELNMVLNNDSNIFTPTNSNSIIYSGLSNQVKVILYKNAVEYGTFYVVDWNTPNKSGKKVANVRAVDRLQNVLNTPVNVLSIEKNMMLKDFIEKVFISVGFEASDLIIDESLTQVLNYTISNGDKLSSVLNDISISGDCYIYVNNVNKIVVKSKTISGLSSHTISGATNLINVEQSKSVLSNYNALKLTYSSVALSDIKELVSLKDELVKVGESSIDNIKLDDGNVYNIAFIKVLSLGGVYAKGLSFNQSDLSINLVNSNSEDMLCEIKGYGRTIEASESYVERLDETLISKSGRKDLNLESKLIQSKADADILIDKLWGRANLKVPYMSLDVIDEDFLYYLCDICDITSNAIELSAKGYIHSLKYDWKGGNSVRIKVGVKVIE